MRMAVRSWRRAGVLAAIAVAVGTFGLTVSANGYFAVAEEKSAPCELTAMAQSIDDALVAETEKIEGVVAATPIIDVMATLKIGDYTAELTIQGVEPGYLQDEIAEGEAIPQSGTSMPYIVLNEAALDAFTDENGRPLRREDKVDWQEGETLLDGERPLMAKVCGILADESLEPRAYMSLESARQATLRSGMVPAYSAMWIRVTDQGTQERVAEQLMNLGIMAEIANPEQLAAWAEKETESLYLGLAGLAVLLCAYWMIATKAAVDWSRERPAYEALRYLGATAREVDRVIFLRQALGVAAGWLIGVAIAAAVPSFVVDEMGDGGVYAYALGLPAAALTLALNAILCLALYGAGKRSHARQEEPA